MQHQHCHCYEYCHVKLSSSLTKTVTSGVRCNIFYYGFVPFRLTENAVSILVQFRLFFHLLSAVAHIAQLVDINRIFKAVNH